MVDLPGVPRRNPTTEAARSRLSGADIAAPFSTMADAAGAVADVSLAWHKRAEEGLESEKRNQIDLGVSDLRRKYAANPDQLEPALKEFSNKVTEGVNSAGLRDRLTAYTANVGTSAIIGERDRQFQVTNARAEGADKARVEVLATRAASLARNGQGGTADFQNVLGEIQEIQGRRAEHPLSPYSAEEADLDQKVLLDNLTIEGIFGGVERSWDKTPGDPAAKAAKALETAMKLVENGGFQDRPGAEKKVTDFVRSLMAVGKQEQAVLKEEAESSIEDVRSNPRIAFDPSLDATEEKLRAAGLHREAGTLRAARETARAEGAVRMPPNVRRDINRGGGISVSRETDAASLIAEFEGFRDRPYFDVNALRTGYGSDTVTRADGTVEKVADGTRVSREEAKLDLDRRIGEFQAGIIKDVGADKWASLPKGAQAALSSVAYNYGRLPTVVAGAVASGDLNAIADAVEGLKGHNDGVNSGRRMQEAAIIRGAPMGTVVHSEVSKEMLAAAKAQQKIVDDDPLQVWNMTRDASQPDARLADIDFSNPEASGGEIAKRVVAARFVRNLEGLPSVPAFQPADATAFAAAVASGDPEVAGQALGSVASLPDDVLIPTIGMADVKSAIQGAARSNDPVRYKQAMAYIGQMYARAPQDVQHALGADAIKEMQDYQSAARYYSETELADRLKNRNDPALMARQKELREEGEKIARRKSSTTSMTGAELVESVVGRVENSWFRPDAPTSAAARDALTSDYITVFGERYAATLDETLAHQQTAERLRTVWKDSDINGGRLTMYAPEVFYDPVDGSHAWMAEQLEADLVTQLGEVPEGYELVPDRQTRADADAGRAPSYFVVVKRADGRDDFVRGKDGSRFRYSWDHSKPADQAAARFQRQRDWVVNGKVMPDATLRERVSMVGSNVRAMIRGEPTRNVFASVESFDTELSAGEEQKFSEWKAKFAPKDSGEDYDFRGAFKAGLKPGDDGHWPDTFKKPNHPTFSDESKYAKDKHKAKAGRWDGDRFIPAGSG